MYVKNFTTAYSQVGKHIAGSLFWHHEESSETGSEWSWWFCCHILLRVWNSKKEDFLLPDYFCHNCSHSPFFSLRWFLWHVLLLTMICKYSTTDLHEMIVFILAVESKINVRKYDEKIIPTESWSIRLKCYHNILSQVEVLYHIKRRHQNATTTINGWCDIHGLFVGAVIWEIAWIKITWQ